MTPPSRTAASTTSPRGATRKTAHRSETAESASVEPLLLFSTSADTRMAMPLSIVARLEEIDPASIERSSGHMVVQYRGEILPLVDLTDSPASRWEHSEAPLNVVVYVEGERSVGLVVEKIIDTVDEVIRVQHAMRRPGTLGAVVIQGKVTDLLDINSVLQRKAGDIFNRGAAA